MGLKMGDGIEDKRWVEERRWGLTVDKVEELRVNSKIEVSG